MLRALLTPRMVGLHLLLIAVLVSFTLLGRWQLGVFESSGKPRLAADPAPIAIADLTQPGKRVDRSTADRRVTAEGAYDAAHQLLVPGRAPSVEGDGQGLWLLTPLRLDDGTFVAVVRGWVPAASDPATAVPEGRVTVTGRLQPAEETDTVSRGVLPAGQVSTVSTAQLINLWPQARLRDGFVVASAQLPPSAAKLVATPAPTEAGGFSWRNLAYAAQWWIFALFGVFMWWHYVREAAKERKRATAGPPVPVDMV
ncbi:SURF1 family protein [Streptosporangiaceae bacterium NEAU-GS5]|nr:SURF1 family protein [Streptosporangiaceae bacterium NEAU-GS5]